MVAGATWRNTQGIPQEASFVFVCGFALYHGATLQWINSADRGIMYSSKGKRLKIRGKQKWIKQLQK